jgi:hypothetical protein
MANYGSDVYICFLSLGCSSLPSHTRVHNLLHDGNIAPIYFVLGVEFPRPIGKNLPYYKIVHAYHACHNKILHVQIPYKMGRVVIWIITLPCQVVVWIKSLGCKAGVWIQAKWENAGVRVRGTSAGVSSVLIFIAPS